MLLFSLPGPEILREPGIREGQTKIVRENEKVICYSWSLAEKMWKKLGNVDAAGLPSKTVKTSADTSVNRFKIAAVKSFNC